MSLTWEEIEALRDETFRRTRAQQVRTIAQAEQFINAVGFCFAFKAVRSELPCLWHAAAGERRPAYPLHVQHDPTIGLVWEAKDQLAAAKKVYYGKALKKRPTFISLDFFPHFYKPVHERRGGDYMTDYRRGGLSRDAKRILEALLERSPQITADLKASAAMSNPDRRAAFDAAMSELQCRMYLVKIGEFYNPFTFLWDLVERRFAEEIAASAAITVEQAREKVLTQYFKLLWAADAKAIERLFGRPPAAVQATLAELSARGDISDRIEIAGEKARFYGLPELAGR